MEKKTRIVQMMPANGWNIVYHIEGDYGNPFSIVPVVMWLLVRVKDHTGKYDEIYGVPAPQKTKHDSFLEIDNPSDDDNFLGYIRDGENPGEFLRSIQDTDPSTAE